MSLNKILREEILKEGVSKEVYHFLHPTTLNKILSTNKMNLSTSMGTNADNIGGAREHFFMSLSRTKFPNHGYGTNMFYNGENSLARIEFDGEKLNRNFKGSPVDYWGRKDPTHKDFSGAKPEDIKYRMMRDFEYEDRLQSYKSEIANINKYIKSVSVYIVDITENIPLLKEILTKCSALNIEVNIYNDKKAFSYDQKDKRVNDSVINNSENSPYDEYKRDLRFNWIMLSRVLAFVHYDNDVYQESFIPTFKSKIDYYLTNLFNVPEEELADMRERVYYRASEYMRGFNSGGSHMISDAMAALQSDVHNLGKNGENSINRKCLDILSKELRRMKVKNLHELIFLKVLGHRPQSWGRVNDSEYYLAYKPYYEDDEYEPIPNDTSRGDIRSFYLTYDIGLDRDLLYSLFDKNAGEILSILLNKFTEEKVKQIIEAASVGNIVLLKGKPQVKQEPYDLYEIIKEEIEITNRESKILQFLKSELDIKSKIVMGEGNGLKVADIPFPKAGIFHITVNMDDTFESVKNLAKELVYVKLIETNRLKYINDSLISFDGQQFNLQDVIPDLPFTSAVENMVKGLTNKYWHKINMPDIRRSFFEDVQNLIGDKGDEFPDVNGY